MSGYAEVVIESNLKPSQFGKSGGNNEDFEETYESPLEKSKPMPPRMMPMAEAVEELPRNEPEIMEFSNARKTIEESNNRVKTLNKRSTAGFTNEGFDQGSEANFIPDPPTRKSENLESQDLKIKPKSLASVDPEKGKNDPPPPSPPEQDKPDIGFRSMINAIKSLDVNRYATKKTIAQGMLDIALLTANASQLKYILQVGKQHEFYILMLSLICTSIGLQAFVGVLYVIIGGLNINKSRDHRAALILNDLILLGVFLISLINIIISGFGMEQSNAHIAYQYSAAYNRKRHELYPEKATDSPN
ncbi:uncharacterized protein LOC124301251 isoform X1 [Neodiprion virginianus]|uniref:uncharacterized protein LOC124301251 isoform X1 n=1 Tax=Neodiprion virginianus TaxID=2961670 RepID=UPI001EE718DE|nr:uncharacterized protein LOC124301251 isoform X1 [Neodiprion virginianus]XP_046612035.1 uncharacterized protein LOC124301251 isoform X1 [Neodiprion virginianus]XP_046612036.1 uncharacterized protein LOC124301251 isoform X1 [Neodiprion virginianus]XP_046612037.1 uncharacterized protein LOC124301251 isoform X1 [Neodiprion virginianus]XP_046612038.1 uncharacterized protein LOC124301251 isoform X1 [Neodiprion virginianus]